MTGMIQDPFGPMRKMMFPHGVPHRLAAAMRDQRIEDAESELLFLGLFTRALLDILVEKDLCSLPEIAARMERLDSLDGKADHGLDPREVAEELGVEMPERDRRREFTERLSKKPHPRPGRKDR